MIVVTGSAGHLGEALMRTLRAGGRAAFGVDLKPSPYTDAVDSIADRASVRRWLAGAVAVLHTATLHKPHVATHTRQNFVDTNVTGTLNLLEEAAVAGVSRFVLTSTTSVYGHALHPDAHEPAVFVDETLVPRPKNIYGVTKVAAESLAELVAARERLPCVVLRTGRFFPEIDDDPELRGAYDDENIKVNELLHRRADLEDVVGAHLAALERAPAIGFARYVVAATTPLLRADAEALRCDPAAVLARRVPAYAEVYAARGWRLPREIARVYDNDRARRELGWTPRRDFAHAIDALARGEDWRSPLATSVGRKGYHAETFVDGPYPVV